MTANPPHPGRCLLRPTATPAGLFWLVTRVVAVPPVRGLVDRAAVRVHQRPDRPLKPEPASVARAGYRRVDLIRLALQEA
jgi:hypothetical protein